MAKTTASEKKMEAKIIAWAMTLKKPTHGFFDHEFEDFMNGMTLAGFCYDATKEHSISGVQYPHYERVLLYAKKKLKTKTVQNDPELYQALDKAYGNLLSVCCDYLEDRLATISKY